MSGPRITPADQQAYARVAGLPVGAPVRLGNKTGTFTGMAGYLITLKVKRRTVYLRAGDPLIKDITI